MDNPFFVNPNPNCLKNCQFMDIGPTTSTLAYYIPMWDKEGNSITPPSGNIIRGKIRCITCQSTWDYETHGGKTTSTEVK